MARQLETLLKLSILNLELGPNISNLTSTSVTTAGAATLTAAAILGGVIARDPNGGNRTDVLPTAALLVAEIRKVARLYGVQLPAGLSFEFVISNTADAAETITINAGTGGTVISNHTMTIDQNYSKRFNIQITNTTPGSEAYNVRNRGAFLT